MELQALDRRRGAGVERAVRHWQQLRALRTASAAFPMTSAPKRHLLPLSAAGAAAAGAAAWHLPTLLTPSCLAAAPASPALSFCAAGSGVATSGPSASGIAARHHPCFRGLRVRMGIATGLLTEGLLARGSAVMDMAKGVESVESVESVGSKQGRCTRQHDCWTAEAQRFMHV